MITLNFTNVEELIFEDRKAQSVLPGHFFSIFEQWRLAQQLPQLREVGKHAILDFINGLDDTHLELLEAYFDERVTIERLNYSVAKNIKVPLGEACDALCRVDGFNQLGMWRDDEFLYISFWR